MPLDADHIRDPNVQVVKLAGLSKAWGLPGLRIGWLATHDVAVLQRVLELKDYTTM